MPVAQTSPEIAAPKPLWSWKLAPAFIVVTSAIPLFGFENRLVGYPWLVIGLVVAYVVDRELTRDLGIIAAGLIVVSTVSVKADISSVHALGRSGGASACLIGSYVPSRIPA